MVSNYLILPTMSSLFHPPYVALHLLKNLTLLAYHITFQPFTTHYYTFTHSCQCTQFPHTIQPFTSSIVHSHLINISISILYGELILILHYCWLHFSNTCISTTPPSSPLVVSMPIDLSPSLPFVFHIMPLANALSFCFIIYFFA